MLRLSEYGGFEVDVIPLENACFNYPEDRATDGPEDTSFTFYVTHDEETFILVYVMMISSIR